MKQIPGGQSTGSAVPSLQKYPNGHGLSSGSVTPSKLQKYPDGHKKQSLTFEAPGTSLKIYKLLFTVLFKNSCQAV